ncbi:MAG: DNA-processing protein DprA [bacterium JZ-2024 1]
MRSDSAVYLLALKLSGFTDANIYHLLSKADPQEAYERAEKILGKLELKGAPRKVLPEEAERTIHEKRMEYTTLLSPDYPVLLKQIEDPPPVLFYRGTLPPADAFCFAIVGTRTPTVYGKQVARYFARELARIGMVITSGFARGTDREAHQGALDTERVTVAVLGSGVDVVYPAEHKSMYYRILEKGAVISEQPPGTMPDRYNFPGRNRIISGISRGVLIVESGEQSGALITAQYALEQNREVFAIPGRIDSPKSKGPHRLIRSCRARLVADPADILEEFPEFGRNLLSAPTSEVELSDEEREVLQHIGDEPTHLEEISEKSSLADSVVLSVLTQLELKGIVQKHPGGTFTRAFRV